MAVYEERVAQQLVVGEELQLFRDQDRIFQFTSKESQNVQPVIRNVSKGQIVFEIAPSQYHFTLSDFILNCSFRVVQADGTPLAVDDETVAVVDNIHYSLFSTCRVKINEYQAWNLQDTFPLFMYLQDRLAYSKAANDTWRRDMLGIYPDTPGENDTAGYGNQGWVKRCDLINGSRIVSTKGRLPIPCMQSGKAWLPGTRFTITLEHRFVLVCSLDKSSCSSPDSFRLHCQDIANTHKIELTDISITVTRAQVRPEIQQQIYATLDRERSINYYSRTLELIGPSHIPVGSTTYDAVISRGVRPQIMFCVLVPTVNMQGIRDRTPFNFVHANIRNAITTFEGLISFPVIDIYPGRKCSVASPG